MARRLGALVAALLAVTANGSAQEWTLSGAVSQRVEADTNKRVDPDTPGAVIGFTTGLDLAVEAETQRASWSLEGGLRGSRFFGEGADEDLDRVDPNVQGSVEFRGKRYQTTSSFSLTRRGTSLTEFEDTGIVDQDVTQTQVRLDSGVLFLVDPRNRMSVDGFASLRRFSEEIDGLTPSETYGISSAWVHDIDPRTAVRLQLGLRRFTTDSPDLQTESFIYDANARVDHQLSQRLSFGLGGGVSVTDQNEEGAGGFEDSELVAGLNGEAELAYELETTRLTLAASQRVEPSASGDLQNQSRVSVNLSEELTEVWRLAFSTSYIRQSAQSDDGDVEGGDTRQSVVLSPTLSTRLTPDWRMEFGYALRLTDGDAGAAISNSVFLGITRELAFVP